MPLRPSPRYSLDNPARRAIRSTDDREQDHLAASSRGETYGDDSEWSGLSRRITVPVRRDLPFEIEFSVIALHGLAAGGLFHFLAGYQKIQLADLAGTLQGPAHGSAALRRKKSELVSDLAALFSQAAKADGKVEDRELAKRANAWMPRSTDQ